MAELTVCTWDRLKFGTSCGDNWPTGRVATRPWTRGLVCPARSSSGDAADDPRRRVRLARLSCSPSRRSSAPLRSRGFRTRRSPTTSYRSTSRPSERVLDGASPFPGVDDPVLKRNAGVRLSAARGAPGSSSHAVLRHRPSRSSVCSGRSPRCSAHSGSSASATRGATRSSRSGRRRSWPGRTRTSAFSSCWPARSPGASGTRGRGRGWRWGSASRSRSCSGRSRSWFLATRRLWAAAVAVSVTMAGRAPGRGPRSTSRASRRIRRCSSGSPRSRR